MKLSALVCAHNDEARLATCLRGLEFCDEIVVVADRCTDRSQDVARQYGARVIDGIFPMESQRKTAGLAACLGEWVLEVEPDEQVDANLAYEIRAAIHGRPGGDWFDVPVDNFVGAALVRRGWGAGLGEAMAARLYRQRVKRWKAGRIDPTAVLEGRFAGELETPLSRHTDADVGQMIARLNRLSALRAQDLADAGEAGALLGDMARGLGRFWTSYVWRQGLREGELGFLIALMSGLDAIVSGIRARGLVRARAVTAAEPAIQPARLGLAGRR
ncbi:glycosyltransferase [Phenylobacterium sp.]|uniref:glycosyltransferase n=1 Tax=Phenylobacterium sp. TaxID=1871053 RepID=UPI00122791D1|nr:glycosyltransferase [Phenylobacterium sp.]THD71159.1 MAG: glycosyltransferase family 2 protein [Phenylobacterium sp.]